MIAVLTVALGYAAAGWPVFLLGRSKRPLANCANCPGEGQPGAHDPQGCTCLTCHGFYAATRDRKAIGRMFSLEPRGMLAIRTGAASSLVVIDIDPRNDGTRCLTMLREQGMLPPTRHVRTGGYGWHLYYRHPGPHIRISGGRNRLGPGIDVKADGGYVVAPPAIHPITREPYTWADPTSPISEMPPSLRQLLLTPDPRPAPPATGGRPASLRGEGGISSPAALLDAHLDAVRRAPNGRRRVTVYGAARGVARMVAAGAISPADAQAALLEVGLAAGQTERDCYAAITGGFRDEGVTI